MLGETPTRLENYGEALVAAGERRRHGRRPQGARARAEARRRGCVKARLLPRARRRAGWRQAAAAALYRELAADAPVGSALADPPQLDGGARFGCAEPALRHVCSGRSGRARRGAAIAALPEGDQLAAIRGMVEDARARLDQDGTDVDGWLRLVRSYAVLGEADKARDALARGTAALAGDAAGRAAARCARPRTGDRGIVGSCMSSIPLKSSRMTRKQRRLVLIGGALAVLGIAAGLVLFALHDTHRVLLRPDRNRREGHPARHALAHRRPGQGRQPCARRRTRRVELRGDRHHQGRSRCATVASCRTCSARGRASWPRACSQRLGEFRADSVLAKHDETYMPREVADALKKQGVWQRRRGQRRAAPALPPAAAQGAKAP